MPNLGPPLAKPIATLSLRNQWTRYSEDEIAPALKLAHTSCMHQSLLTTPGDSNICELLKEGKAIKSFRQDVFTLPG
jgi:hypothetical protein